MYLVNMNFESWDENSTSEDAGSAGLADGDVTFGPNLILQFGRFHRRGRVKFIKNNLK